MKTQAIATPDAGTMLDWLNGLVDPGTTIELRIIDASDNPRYGKFTLSGVYDPDHRDVLVRDALQWTAHAPACYVTLNPIDPELLARSANELTKKPEKTTSDHEIVSRARLMIDIDPIRWSKTTGKRLEGKFSATDEEKQAALARAEEIRAHLAEAGWTEPAVIDSGNGAYLVFAVDLPAEDDGLVHRCLQALAKRFDDALAEVDTTCANPARILKLAGTLARKGSSTPSRPHRASCVLSLPEQWEPVPAGLLAALAAEVESGGAEVPVKPVEVAEKSDGWDESIRHLSRTEAESRAHAYLFSSGFPESIEGQRGHDRLFRAACVLVDGFGLSEQQAMPILKEYNDAKAKPPENEKQLAHKLADATKKNPTPSLKLLNAPRPGVSSSSSFSSSGGQVSTSAHAELDHEPVEVRKWPDPVAEDAFHGLAGEVARTIEPATEADVLAILAQFLVAVGCAMGRSPSLRVEKTRHGTNQFVALVGESSVGRKGTAADWIRELMLRADEPWARSRINEGLSSGEGVIWAIRDPIWGKKSATKGGMKTVEDVLVDEGVDDKRLLVIEGEMGRMLRALQRDGNTLSAVLRSAWDSKPLGTMTKSPTRATDPHVSAIGHITRDELLMLVSDVDLVNGMANRWLWLAVRRSKYLPLGGGDVDLTGLAEDVGAAIRYAQEPRTYGLTRQAVEAWEPVYRRLTSPPPGTLGSILSRGAPHVLRLALIYAVLDRSSMIGEAHLRAALALWDASERCARFVFGESTGDPVAEKILAALKSNPNGMTRRTLLVDVLQKNVTADRLTRSLELLLSNRRVHERVDRNTGGRPAYRYVHSLYEQNELNEQSPLQGGDSSFSSFSSYPREEKAAASQDTPAPKKRARA